MFYSPITDRTKMSFSGKIQHQYDLVRLILAVSSIRIGQNPRSLGRDPGVDTWVGRCPADRSKGCHSNQSHLAV